MNPIIKSPILKVLLTALALAFALAGCSVNPVTGERQLSIIPENQEWSMGAEQYKPTQQTQGGLFYLDPELTVYIREVGMKLAAVSDRPDLPYDFVVLNSSVPNAWALPGGKIAINRGLLTAFSDEAQLASVLGHEIVHAAARHSVQRMQQAQIIGLGVGALGLALTDNEWAGMVMGGAAVGAQLALAQHSQDDELESDYYGIRYMKAAGYDPQAAVELQQIFLEMSQGRSAGFIDGLFATHPPSAKRVSENRKLVSEVGSGGYRGEDVYQKKTALLRKLQPAYDAHDKAVELAGKKEYAAAIDKVNQAIKLAPREAMFYNLRGRLHQQRKNLNKAAKDFDKAVELYPEMYVYRIYNGLNALEQNDLSKAKDNLSKANQAVPTSIAFLRLGDIAVKQNDRDEAIAHYRTAAQAGGDIGQEAQTKLTRLTQ